MSKAEGKRRKAKMEWEDNGTIIYYTSELETPGFTVKPKEE